MSQFSDQGLNPALLHWERRILATAPPGRSPLPSGIFPGLILPLLCVCILSMQGEQVNCLLNSCISGSRGATSRPIRRPQDIQETLG